MRAIFFLFLCLIPVNVYAYVGPGAATGAVGVVLGIFMSIFLALFAILWYPFKRLIKRFKNNESSEIQSSVEDS